MNYRGECGREGVGRMEWNGGEWDNCNSIINKYIKKEKKRKSSYIYFNPSSRGLQPQVFTLALCLHLRISQEN